MFSSPSPSLTKSLRVLRTCTNKGNWSRKDAPPSATSATTTCSAPSVLNSTTSHCHRWKRTRWPSSSSTMRSSWSFPACTRICSPSPSVATLGSSDSPAAGNGQTLSLSWIWSCNTRKSSLKICRTIRWGTSTNSLNVKMSSLTMPRC